METNRGFIWVNYLGWLNYLYHSQIDIIWVSIECKTNRKSLLIFTLFHRKCNKDGGTLWDKLFYSIVFACEGKSVIYCHFFYKRSKHFNILSNNIQTPGSNNWNIDYDFISTFPEIYERKHKLRIKQTWSGKGKISQVTLILLTSLLKKARSYFLFKFVLLVSLLGE